MKNNMEMSLKNREWKEFLICDEFEIKNSKAYHKTNLKEAVNVNNGISYVTRTNLNNGVESIVKRQNFKINKSNTIAFGAENATFFYQPNEYITGNKMYFIQHKNLNKYSGLFLQLALNKSIENCGFGYGKGLTGSRVQKRFISLPINSQGEPDYEFMENYMRAKEQEKINAYKNYISKRIKELENVKPVVSLKEKDWAEFEIQKLFNTKIGKNVDGNKVDKVKGKTAYITRKESNNGLDGFINFESDFLNVEKPVITIGNETAEPFVQTYEFFTGTKVNILIPKEKLSAYSLKFIATSLRMHKSKYSYSFTINSTRLRKQKILLPINEKKEPDYEYMENYIKRLELEKIKKYLDYKELL